MQSLHIIFNFHICQLTLAGNLLKNMHTKKCGRSEKIKAYQPVKVKHHFVVHLTRKRDTKRSGEKRTNILFRVCPKDYNKFEGI